LRVLNGAFDHPLKSEENAAMPLAGGIVQHGYQCGMIWGAALAAGARSYQLLGPGPQAETMAVAVAGRLVETFRSCTGEINCLEITEIDNSSSVLKMIYVFLIKGKTIGCIRLTSKYAKAAFSELNAALPEKDIEAPPPPVSCAAILARKMGVSDKHAVMAAGLAGGIGLCGGACGALGAAIWIEGMKSLEEGAGKIDYKSPRALAVIERFLKNTDFEFECSEIVGRKFGSVADHADYLRGGGCSDLIEVLASE